jgi:YHS domain-containing protein
MQKIGLLTVMICFLFCADSCFSVEQAVDVDNKICPVTGDKIDPKSNITYEYQSKIYHFCCQMCIDPFKKDPQKYIEIINKEKTQ